ncbi:unnamed protein product [Adineta steineri]|uniref:Uncharacterized protein n=1 Tax=Adineta steineri TaxID=433720 RepID=A0A815N6L2_9BILA|nr:unnamed protein product [Adineta steineri]CAF1623974.1 unnamed protein product [Adineta steineri]
MVRSQSLYLNINQYGGEKELKPEVELEIDQGAMYVGHSGRLFVFHIRDFCLPMSVEQFCKSRIAPRSSGGSLFDRPRLSIAGSYGGGATSANDVDEGCLKHFAYKIIYTIANRHASPAAAIWTMKYSFFTSFVE